MNVGVGTKVIKVFEGHGPCTGKVVRRHTVDSTIRPGEEVPGFEVKYDVDGSCDDLELEEIRPLIVTSNNSVRKDVIAGKALRLPPLYYR
eukprot:COSAG02_NODE_1207_length_13885_cov_124.791237_19_plen_90_part_00